MKACDHLPAPDERTRDGECIYCVRDRARAAQQAQPGKPDEITGAAAVAGAGNVIVEEWFKQPGDQVEIGDPVVALQVGGKAVVVAAEMAGHLGIHKAKPGAMVPRTTVLTRIWPPRDGVPASGHVTDVAWPAAAVEVEAAPLGAADVMPQTEPAKPMPPPPPVNEEVPVEQVAAAPEPVIADLPPPAPPAPPAPPPDLVELRPAIDETKTADATPQSEDEQIIGQLKRLRGEGVFIISLIGFYEGGKTWFLNRLKYELDQKGYSLRPNFEPTLTEVARTNNVAIHLANSYDRMQQKARTFAIVDFPGETLKQLIEHPLESSKSLIAAMQMGGALIVSMPADEVLLSRSAAMVRRAAQTDGAAALPPETAVRIERLALADAMLTDFTNEIGFLVGLLSLLRVRSDWPAGTEFDGIDVDAVWSHLSSEQFRPYRQPTYVALTKADTIFKPDALVEQLIGPDDCAAFAQVLLDPREAVLEHRPTLVGKLDQRFDLYKFDFAAAFEGHGANKLIDYDEPHKGIWAVIDWIAWCRGLGALTPGEQAAMRRARRLRDHRDGSLSVSLNGLDDRMEAA